MKARVREPALTSGMNHASVQRKIRSEISNLAGLIQGLSPRIRRSSKRKGECRTGERDRHEDSRAEQQRVAAAKLGDELRRAHIATRPARKVLKRKVGEQADRTEHEGEDQAGDQQQMRDVVRSAHRAFPSRR